MARTRTDTDRLMAAQQLFIKAREELQGINLRTYRGLGDQREAIHEARNSAECGVDWTKEALALAEDEKVIDLREPAKVA